MFVNRSGSFGELYLRNDLRVYAATCAVLKSDQMLEGTGLRAGNEPALAEYLSITDCQDIYAYPSVHDSTGYPKPPIQALLQRQLGVVQCAISRMRKREAHHSSEILARLKVTKASRLYLT